MNAKKIMGAVLVALLAAALFVGAGAAAGTGETVFVNQILGSEYQGSWISGNNAVTATLVPGETDKYYFAGPVVEGVYTQEVYNSADKVIVIKNKPALTITGTANSGVSAYNFIGGILYAGANPVKIIAPAGEGTLYDLYFTPAGIAEYKETAENIGIFLQDKPALKVGDYSIRAVFNASAFVEGTLASDLVTAPVTFKVAKAGEVTISASVDQVLKTDVFKVTITGEPGVIYKVTYEHAGAFSVAGTQVAFVGTDFAPVNTNEGFTFKMPNTGNVEFEIAGTNTAKDSEKLTVVQQTPANADNKASLTVKFTKGTITAEADAASYFVGDEITITGTNTAGEITGYTIKGTNFEYTLAAGSIIFEDGGVSSETFEFTIDTADVKDNNKKLDVGTYTITIFVGPMDKPTAKATVAVALKQPFISIVEAPEVIVQDTKAEFIINAEATTEGIWYYIFGTNFFMTGQEETTDEDVKTNYIVTLDEDTTFNMSTGQYFAVFQHPMYDNTFNVTGDDETWWISVNDVETINVKNRQTANAAQALCDALDVQTIDDMYVKYSFFVIGEDESFTISDIPTSVAQGETITISGVSTANADNTVTVEMVSTAFAAVPKETVGSAAFILVTTTVAEDGTWEVTLDTSDLNVDEYSLNVACEGTTWKNVKVNVVEAADEPVNPEQPEQPENPENPTEPEAPATPGFGALAALAGLGAVAVLLLRRE